MYPKTIKLHLVFAVCVLSTLSDQLLLAVTDSPEFSKKIRLRQINPFGNNTLESKAFRLFFTFTEKKQIYYNTSIELKRNDQVDIHYPETDYYELEPDFLAVKKWDFKETPWPEIAWIDLRVINNQEERYTGYIEDSSELPITEEEHVDFVTSLGYTLNKIDLEKIFRLYYDPKYDGYNNSISVNLSMPIRRVEAKEPKKICYHPDAFVKIQQLNSHKSFSFYSDRAIGKINYNHFGLNNLLTRQNPTYRTPCVDRNKSTESESSDTENSIDANNDMNNL